MPRATRPPPHILLIHDGLAYEAHVTHMTNAGLHVSTSHKSAAVADAAALQPDLIVLDFGSNGEMTAAMKADAMTEHIPVIALVDLKPQG